MQAHYDDDMVSEPETFTEDGANKLLKDGAKKITTFKAGSPENREAQAKRRDSIKRFKDMSPNQKRRLRKRGYK